MQILNQDQPEDINRYRFALSWEDIGIGLPSVLHWHRQSKTLPVNPRCPLGASLLWASIATGRRSQKR